MLEGINNKINSIVDDFLNMYADQIKGEIDEEDVRKLTLEQQKRLRIVMELAANFSSMNRVLQNTMVKQYVKSMIAINKMRDIPKKVDEMLKGEATVDEVERMIAAIPEERLLESNDEESNKVYSDYCESMYKFMLYANFIGRNKLLKENKEIQNIVRGMAEKEAHELYPHPELAPELRDAATRVDGKELPSLGLRDAIIAVDQGRCKDGFLDDNLLQELQANKAGIVCGKVSEELGQKLERIGVIKESMIENKKKGRKALATAALCTTLTAVVVVWPVFSTLHKFVKYKQNKLYKPNITMDGQTEGKDYSAGSLEFVTGEEAREMYNNGKSNEKRFVTEFNTRPDNKVEVKIYDYTDSDMSDDELKGANLDEEKLVYHRTLDKTSEEITSSAENFAGQFTGDSSRSVSKIKFGLSGFDDVTSYLSSTLIWFIIINAWTCYFLNCKPVPSKLINAVIKDFNKTISSIENNGMFKEQLGKLKEEAKALEDQAKIESLYEERLKAIAERDQIDSELANYAVSPNPGPVR